MNSTDNILISPANPAENEALVPASIPDEDIAEMMKAGVHIGHVPSKTNPKMASFVYGQRNGVAIFDLAKTKVKLLEAETFLKKLVREGKNILLVGTKPAARKFITHLGDTYGYPVIANRWIGGTLTNSKVILGRVQELERLEREKAEGGFKKYTKKEAMGKEEEIVHLQKTFGGLRKLKKLPDALLLADIDEDTLAVREALRMRVPVIAITNSSTDPTSVTYPIPANDNSIPALQYIFNHIEKSIKEAKTEALKKAENE